MTDVQNTPNAPTPEQAIAYLKKQATTLGISFKANVSVETLRKQIEAKLADPAEESEGEVQTLGITAAQAKAIATEANYDKAMKLHRVVITAMEATKATNLESESFTAGNSVVGTVTRVIPFGVEWHVEEVLLNSIREKKFQLFVNKKNAKGVEVTTARLAPAYNIATLPELTPEEIQEIADRQERTRTFQDED